ncbi:MAG: chemotaxis protein CheB [Candidatus Kariarchaeaceae archaeon]
MPVRIIIAEKKRSDLDRISSACKGDLAIEIVGAVSKGLDAISLTVREKPDVLILSTELDDIPCYSIIKKIMDKHPTPVLLIKTYSSEVVNIDRIIDYGIVDIITAPTRADLNEFALTTRVHILSKLRISKFTEQIQRANSNIHRKNVQLPARTKWDYPDFHEDANDDMPTKKETQLYSGQGRNRKIIIIGTSTGGPRVLSKIVPSIPPNFPPVVIVQHMPIGFVDPFAKRLNRLSTAKVKQAEDGEPISAGTIYIAPAGYHLEIKSISSSRPARFSLNDGAEVNFVKPAVDITLQSAGRVYGSGVIGVILTGMGHDGRDGCKMIKEMGGKVIALNEKDSDIYGMNKAVIEAGLADAIISKADMVEGMINAIEGLI